MYIEANEKRLLKLNTEGFELGDTIIFCPACDWQIYEPGICMKNECPNCKTKLHLHIYEGKE